MLAYAEIICYSLYMENRHLASIKAILEKIHYINLATVNEDDIRVEIELNKIIL